MTGAAVSMPSAMVISMTAPSTAPVRGSRSRRRGRDQRSSTLTTGSARATARARSTLATEPARMACGNHGSGRRTAICVASRISMQAETLGTGRRHGETVRQAEQHHQDGERPIAEHPQDVTNADPLAGFGGEQAKGIGQPHRENRAPLDLPRSGSDRRRREPYCSTDGQGLSRPRRRREGFGPSQRGQAALPRRTRNFSPVRRATSADATAWCQGVLTLKVAARLAETDV